MSPHQCTQVVSDKTAEMDKQYGLSAGVSFSLSLDGANYPNPNPNPNPNPKPNPSQSETDCRTFFDWYISF